MSRMYTFEDNFSKQAKTYAQYRPQYPAALFKYLAELAPGKKLAWDCATGNGQAAVGLAMQFEKVVATDASAEQLKNAFQHPRVHYLESVAEHTPIASGSVDLVTVAQALHWFNFELFFAEVHRVLKPAGLFAAWGYYHDDTDSPVDRVILQFQKEIIGPFFSPRIQYWRDRYLTLPKFPFEEVPSPKFHLEVTWSLAQCIGYLYSWSATQAYFDAKQEDPVMLIRDRLTKAWGNPTLRRDFHWPIYMRVGRQG